MSSNLITITVRDKEFIIREEYREVLQHVAQTHETDPWGSIQALLVGIFDVAKEVRTDEVTATVAAFFPQSKYTKNSAKRTSVDVKKYNKGQLAGQDGKPDETVVHLDAPVGGAKKAADDALDVLMDLMA